MKIDPGLAVFSACEEEDDSADRGRGVVGSDHERCRYLLFKLIADRLPEDRDLASQPTLSRFENAVRVADPNRLRDSVGIFADAGSVRHEV